MGDRMAATKGNASLSSVEYVVAWVCPIPKSVRTSPHANGPGSEQHGDAVLLRADAHSSLAYALPPPSRCTALKIAGNGSSSLLQWAAQATNRRLQS